MYQLKSHAPFPDPHSSQLFINILSLFICIFWIFYIKGISKYAVIWTFFYLQWFQDSLETAFIYIKELLTINKLLKTLKLGCAVTTMKSSFKEPAQQHSTADPGGRSMDEVGWARESCLSPPPFLPLPSCSRQTLPSLVTVLREWALHLTLGITVELSLVAKAWVSQPHEMRAWPYLSLAGCSIV